MNTNISQLNRIAAKKSRLIIGLMSGTSLDGLDVALCRVSESGKSTKVDVVKFKTWVYPHRLKVKILRIFAKTEIDFQLLCELNAELGRLHGKLVLKSLAAWGLKASQIDLVASHGQTVFHAPQFLYPQAKVNATLQIGDGDHLAVETGIITISDFRQKHVAKGGEGAPLAVYGDYLLFSKKGEDRIMLNAGGIGNFTFLPASAKASEVFVTDTGPANTLIDQVVRKCFPNASFDKDAALAGAGKYNPSLLKVLKSNPFFKKSFPKTIGPELFNLDYVEKAQARSNTKSISVEDLLASLTRLSAETIAEAILKVIKDKKSLKLFMSGGGAHNPLLVKWLKELLPQVAFHKMIELGVSGDAKEAVLFAILANETVAGGKVKFGSDSKVPCVSMGKISFPR
ncbi:MAG: anhydro-N-acetylmuramic acid kinase [Cyclobacteriaceae bacterium]|jgi:anhydro-N-acetylmuramic acid kinase|nr:anhydro-N-acetylmuramic acid kinase [Cyclobacteriaceae bacterium]